MVGMSTGFLEHASTLVSGTLKFERALSFLKFRYCIAREYLQIGYFTGQNPGHLLSMPLGSIAFSKEYDDIDRLLLHVVQEGHTDTTYVDQRYCDSHTYCDGSIMLEKVLLPA